MKTTFILNQKIEMLKLRVKHLSDYLETQTKIEDGAVDDPELNDIIDDIDELHREIIP